MRLHLNEDNCTFHFNHVVTFPGGSLPLSSNWLTQSFRSRHLKWFMFTNFPYDFFLFHVNFEIVFPWGESFQVFCLLLSLLLYLEKTILRVILLFLSCFRACHSSRFYFLVQIFPLSSLIFFWTIVLEFWTMPVTLSKSAWTIRLFPGVVTLSVVLKFNVLVLF